MRETGHNASGHRNLNQATQSSQVFHLQEGGIEKRERGSQQERLTFQPIPVWKQENILTSNLRTPAWTWVDLGTKYRLSDGSKNRKLIIVTRKFELGNWQRQTQILVVEPILRVHRILIHRTSINNCNYSSFSW